MPASVTVTVELRGNPRLNSEPCQQFPRSTRRRDAPQPTLSSRPRRSEALDTKKTLRRISLRDFDQFDLSPAMNRALRRAGYVKPSPVQSGLIPLALDDHDVIGQARTGTGKTASFVIPILERLDDKTEPQRPQALVLVPTRELALQVHTEVEKLSHGQPFRSVAVYGGAPFRSQATKLQTGVHMVVGTPGRVIDHLQRGTLRTDALWCVVLDEADRMLDIGFRPAIEKILRLCPTDRQTLLLSATVPDEIRLLARRYMHHPTLINLSPRQVAADTIDQYYFSVPRDRKRTLLLKLLEREQPKQAIVFCRTKIQTQRIFRFLQDQRIGGVGCIHGDMTQSARTATMSQFRAGKITILVATDVVGRGIDVSGISHIINFDIPELCDDYVHRVGRTGRMGQEGVAYTFVEPGQGEFLTAIEVRIDKLLKRDDIDVGGGEVPDDPRAPAAANPAAESSPPPPKPDSRKKRYRSAL